MPALFPPVANTILRLALVGAAASAAGGVVFALAWARSPAATGQREVIEQPVQFDHRHHVVDDGIDCYYCHGSARVSAYAGVPGASVCMSCHAQVWNGSALLEPVRASAFSGRPIAWERVNRLPGFVYFDHQAHVSHGVGCVSCHGRVDQMAEVFAAEPLTMQFCIDCHRDPASRLRPDDKITDMAWTPPGPETGRAIQRKKAINPPTECSGCHR
jgi:hypothetical protein